MKILHTSDWHLGHQLYGYDRTDEQLQMLSQMAQIVADENPDVFLIAGDVFHISQPSATAQKMFVNGILKIRQANPKMRIIITAGNHDSGSRHEIFRAPWSVLGVDVIGTLNFEDPSQQIIKIENIGFVVAVPFVNERFIPENYYQKLLDIVSLQNAENLPVVMMAHTTVGGADFTGHERYSENVVGGIESVELARFGTGYDYLALGHIHRGQFVHSGKRNVLYSGSPLAISFDEDYPHSVSIVEIKNHGGVAEIHKIELESIRPLVNLPIDGFTDWDNAKKLLKNFPQGKDAYIRLNVEVDNFLPSGAVDEARKIAESKGCRFCLINERRKRNENRGQTLSLTVSEFKEISPVEIARRFVEEKGGTWVDDMDEMFREAMDSVLS